MEKMKNRHKLIRYSLFVPPVLLLLGQSPNDSVTAFSSSFHPRRPNGITAFGTTTRFSPMASKRSFSQCESSLLPTKPSSLSSSSLQMLPTSVGNHAALAASSIAASFMLADGAMDDVFAAGTAATASGIFGTLQSIAVGITAILFFLAGLTLLMANIIIPAAAKELAKECLELAPDLWQEYQRKLEPGQSMAQRPELMQELGEKLQPLLDAKIATIAQAKGVSVEELLGEDTPIRFSKTKLEGKREDDDDDDDDSWTNSPSVDLSEITDQIQSPKKDDSAKEGDS